MQEQALRASPSLVFAAGILTGSLQRVPGQTPAALKHQGTYEVVKARFLALPPKADGDLSWELNL